jgi:sortase A
VSFTTIRVTVGRVVLVAGILVLLFIPYLLWGTGLQTARSQSELRTQFTYAQRHTGVTSTAKPVNPKSGAQPVAKAAPSHPDPPIGSAVGTVTIPSIDLSMVVVEGTGTAQLQAGPGHYSNTPLPGEDGNAAIAGHRTTYLHPFYNLNELVPGDSITVVTLQGIFLFHVTSSQSVLPSDVSVIAATTTPTLTLTTCTPRYSASERLVVHAALVASILAHPNVSGGTKPAVAPTTSSVVSSTPAPDWTAAILLGLLVVVLTTGVWMWERRSHRGRKVAVIAGGLVAWLVVVFFFFEALAPLLPASY